jgi:hypothetical protein
LVFCKEVTACSIWLAAPGSDDPSPSAPGELICRQASGPQSEIVRGWRLPPGVGIADGNGKKQPRAIQELSTPVIPVMDRILVMPLVGSIDTLRAKDIMRTLLAGIREHRARVVLLDVSGGSISLTAYDGRV